jgi:putative FmdB family regulatory protein
MPLYEYECTVCHRHTEKIQKFSDPEITQCPHCGGLLKRVITAPAFSLKGGGWYADGYASAKPPASSGEGKESAPSGDTASKSSDTPASPAPAAPAATPAPSSGEKT